MKDFRSHARLKGIASQDPHYASLLLPAYREAFGTIASYTYRSLLTEPCTPELSALFDLLASNALRHFQTLGELILALGGNPILYTQLRIDAAEPPCENTNTETLRLFLRESIREEQIAIDRLETVMSKTDDRVVRSVLSQMVTERQSHLRKLAQIAE